MTDLAELQRKASGRDYRPMARLARSLYEAGDTVRSVMRACYGVDLPEEFYVIAAALAVESPPHGTYMNQPWYLAVPLERGGPPPDPPRPETMEQRALAIDPKLMPLLYLRGSDTRYGGSLLCYRLDELDQSRPTIFGLRDIVFDDDAVAERYGASLVDVLHDHCSQRVRQLQAQFDSLYNRGAGSIDETYVGDARAALERVEEAQRELAGASLPKP